MIPAVIKINITLQCQSGIKTHKIVIQDEITEIIEERAIQFGWTLEELIQEYLKIAAKTLKETKLV